MAEWWESAPVVEQPQAAGNWYEAAPLANAPSAPVPQVQPRSAAQSLDEAARWAANFATLGFADKLAAYMGSLGGRGQYEELLKQERARSQQAEENVPLAAKIPLGAAGIAPMVLAGGPAGALAAGARLANLPTAAGALGRIAAPTTTAGRIGAGVAEGAGLGALEAVGRDTDVAGGAALGGLLGGVGGAVVSPLLARTTAQKTDLTAAKVKQAAGEAYDLARSEAVYVTPQSYNSFAQGINRAADDFALDPVLEPGASSIVKRINDFTKQPVDLIELDKLRKRTVNLGKSNNASDREFGRIIRNNIDDYVASINPATDVALGKDVAKQSVEAFQTARDLWSRQAKASTIDEAIRRAELSAPNFSASGVENALRTEFRALAKNKAAMRAFNDEERKAIEAVAKGGPLTNTLRMMGKMAPRGIVGGGMLVQASAANPTLGMAMLLAGEVGRKGASARTVAAAESARNLMLSGQPITPRVMSPAEQALYQAAVSGGGVYGGGLLGQ